MAATTVESSKVNNSIERLHRKRLAAKLRQQRCRARKREAVLVVKQKQDKDSMANSSINFITTTTKTTKRPVLISRNEQLPVRMSQQHLRFTQDRPPMQPMQHRQEFNVHRHQNPKHHFSNHRNKNCSSIGSLFSFEAMNAQQCPRKPYHEKMSYSYHHKHHQIHGLRQGPASAKQIFRNFIPRSVTLLMDLSIPVQRSSLNIVKTASTNVLKSKEELAIDAMLSLRLGETVSTQANKQQRSISTTSREMHINRMRPIPYI